MFAKMISKSTKTDFRTSRSMEILEEERGCGKGEGGVKSVGITLEFKTGQREKNGKLAAARRYRE